MAKRYDNKKGFLIIEMTFKEAKEICNFGIDDIIVCDNCNKLIHEDDNVYYFGALNRCFCKQCCDNVIFSLIHYKDDEDYEKKHYNFYANKLNIEKV